jgi:hypothetical protein
VPLSADQRKALPDSDFAVPGKRALPINDARHVRMAWSQVDHTSGLSDDERAEARTRIRAKAKELDVDTSGWAMKAAANDGLYVRRDLTPESAAAVREWASGQGFLNIVPDAEMHATIVHSRLGVPMMPAGGEIRVTGGDRSVAPLGDKGAIVLFFESEAFQARFDEAMAAGATHDFGDYVLHLTVTYDGEPVDLDEVVPFEGDLVFGPEVHQPLDAPPAEEKGMRMQAAASVLLEGESMEAMSLEMPDVKGHPNRMPFSGILTRLDVPSDRPPGGSKGKRVIFTKSAAERALPSLIGMGVNFTPNFDGHDVVNKFAVITAASIEGDAIRVGGHIYARDFPKEASRVQTDKRLLGMSWELADIFVERLDADPLVITDAYFTGATILRKDKAAYGSTSLAASADEDTMTKEEIAAAMGEALAPAIKPLADALTAMAEASTKQTEALSAMQASAASKVDEETKAKDAAAAAELETLKTKVADLQAAAEKASKAPERKTLTPQITALLARADISVPDGDGKLSVGAVDAALTKAGLDPVKRMEIKGALQRADVLA